MGTTSGRSIIIDSHQPNQDNILDSSSIHLSAYTYPCHVLNTYKRETSEKTRKSGKTMTTTTMNQKDKMDKMVKMGEVYKKDTKGSWRHRVWTALYTDNERAFGECFPDAGMVKRASRDIWRPRKPPRERKLIDVLTSLRPHINGGKGALKCLTWLLETYPRVYSVEDMRWLIRRGERNGLCGGMVEVLRSNVRRRENQHIVWAALRTDDVGMFSECFPDVGAVERASGDIWKPRQPPSEKELIEVLTSLRPHINGGKGALKCLTWLLETYPRVYDTGVLKRLRERLESEGGCEEMVALLKGVLL